MGNSQKINKIMGMIIILLLGCLTAAYANQSPAYNLAPGSVKLTSEGDEAGIKIWWRPNAGEKYDVQYKVLNESDNIIAAQNIEASINDGPYHSLDTWVCFLSEDSQANPQDPDKVRFRISPGGLENIPNGEHKLWIFPNTSHIPDHAEGKPLWIKLKLVVDISPEIAIEIENKDLRMNITNPTLEVDPVSTDWYVYTINNVPATVNVSFESGGLEYEGNEDLNPESFFRYLIEAKDEKIYLDSGKQYTFHSVNIPQQSDFYGKLSLKYFPRGKGDNNNWYELKAGEYSDVITITVSEDG